MNVMKREIKQTNKKRNSKLEIVQVRPGNYAVIAFIHLVLFTCPPLVCQT